MNDKSPPQEQKSDQPRPTILVVDDDADMRAAVNAHLKRAGYDVREALDGNQALREIRNGGVSLVVTDVYMPDMDGIEFITRMSRETGGTPIIAMSGGGHLDQESLLEMAKRLGAAQTLAKPFDGPVLLDAVRNALDARSQPKGPR